MSADPPASATVCTLTDAEKQRIERNRQRAIALKQAKLSAHPYAKSEVAANGKTTINVQGTKFIDSGGGFLIDQAAAEAAAARKAAAALNHESGGSSSTTSASASAPSDQEPGVYATCLDCTEPFTESYLLDKFGHSVCDKCRDSDGDHALITRTEAKSEYLLKDCDLDKREPPLRYICRKNPHNERWGDMKLYLHLQVERRALEVWGSEEGLMAQRDQRDEKRDRQKLNKYNKNLKQLRMEMRSTLFDNRTAGPHEHEFGEETYDEEADVYSHACIECGFSQTFEKM